jgi:hypothetical protein
MEEEKEEVVLKIHNCSELPSGNNINLELDADCLNQIALAFKAWKWRGNGAYGFAIETITAHGSPPKKERLIVKVSSVNVNEIQVACALNVLLEETPVFPHTYGWLVGDTVPKGWMLFLKTMEPDHDLIVYPPPLFMFTFVQPVDDKWDDTLLAVENGYRVVLFFLLHGLYVARSRLGFNHGDIHGGNIMMEYHMQQEKENILRYGPYEAEVKSRFVPRFIDYGYSNLNSSKIVFLQGNSDLKSLRDTFEERFHDDILERNIAAAQEESREFQAFIKSSGWENVERVRSPDVILPLLEHDYFAVDGIQRRQVKRQAIEGQLRCFSCCAPSPEHQINHQVAAPKYFCSKWCYEKMHAVCAFIH